MLGAGVLRVTRRMLGAGVLRRILRSYTPQVSLLQTVFDYNFLRLQWWLTGGSAVVGQQ